MAKNIFQKYYGNDRASKVVYGTILIYAYLISQHYTNHFTPVSLMFGTIFASVAIVIAEIYAEIIGKTIKQKKPLTKQQRSEIEQDSFAIISVSLWPSFIFLLSYLGIYNTQVAFNISYIFLITTLVVFSYWASRLSGFSAKRSILTSLIVSAIGVSVVFIKYFLSH